MSVYKELSFENDIDEIKAIQFSVMSPEEIMLLPARVPTCSELVLFAILLT